MKISIVTIVYNRVGTVRDAIDSVARQSYPHIEHIVQDGGSTDGTLEALRDVGNPHLRIVSEKDDGIYDALNRGIKRATGDVIGFVHSDDFLAHPHVLHHVAQCFADPSVDGLYGDLDYVAQDDPNRIIRKWRSGSYDPDRLRRGWSPPHPTLYLRRHIYDTYGSHDTRFRISGDYEATLRYLKRGKIRLAYLPEVMVKMRVGGASNRSIANLLRKSAEDLQAIRMHEIGGIGTLLAKNFRKVPQFISAKLKTD